MDESQLSIKEESKSQERKVYKPKDITNSQGDDMQFDNSIGQGSFGQTLRWFPSHKSGPDSYKVKNR